MNWNMINVWTEAIKIRTKIMAQSGHVIIKYYLGGHLIWCFNVEDTQERA